MLKPRPVIHTDAPSLTFVSIIPNFAEREDYLAQLISERYERTGITDYAMCYPLNPQGDDIMVKPQIQAKSFRRLKELLKGQPVRLGILFQSLLGHGGYWNMTPQCGLTGVKTTRSDGTPTHRFCPYEKNFTDYIDAAVTLLAQEEPAFCMTDDDLRMFSDTCFCSYHIAEVSKKTGLELTREQVVEAVRTASIDADQCRFEFPRLRRIDKPEQADRIAKAWIETQVEAVDHLCRVVRNALDRVNPAITCSPCLVGRPEYADSQVTILAGSTKYNQMRISNGNYLEGAIKEFGAYTISRTGIQMVLYRGKGWTLLDESDTCPHNRFSKTATTMHTHIATGIAMGLDGGKLWLDQGAYPIHEVSRPYEDILGKYQGFYRELHRLAHQWTFEGLAVRVPPLEQGMLTSQEWNACCFNLMGIPSYYDDLNGHAITLLSGAQVMHWTDDQLKKMLSGKVLVDGEAAVELTRRGFDKLIGVHADDQSYAASTEECLLTGIRTGFPAAVDGAAFFTALPGAEPLSRVLYTQFKGDTCKDVMPGALYFRNALGGEIITSAINVVKWHQMHVLNPGRKRIYLAWIEKLGGVSIYAPADQHIKLFAASLPDNEKALTIINLSYDPLPVSFVSKAIPTQVLELQPEGDWKHVTFHTDGKRLLIDRTLAAAEIAVFRLK